MTVNKLDRRVSKLEGSSPGEKIVVIKTHSGDQVITRAQLAEIFEYVASQPRP
jgi:hypothetical protein